MRTVKNLAGMRFGRLVALEHIGFKHRMALWRCQCDCGKVKNVPASPLVDGRTRSCGCLRVEAARDRWRKQRGGDQYARTRALNAIFAPPERVIDRTEKTWASAESAAAILERAWCRSGG